MTVAHSRDPEHPIPPAQSDLALAVATLHRGTGFLATGPYTAGDGASGAIGGASAKVIGNGLRELDRFLSLVLDAVAARIATPRDRATLHRLTNTARKLTMLRAVMALPSPDDAALRAIGHSRNCLFHTGGIVQASRPGSLPTLGWAFPDRRPHDGRQIPHPVGSRIAVSPQDLVRVCRFYDRIADELVAALPTPGPIDLRRLPAYMQSAHVACDGI